jgi:hypothetical protein
MTTTLVVISTNCDTILKWGRAEHVVFSPLALLLCNMKEAEALGGG